MRRGNCLLAVQKGTDGPKVCFYFADKQCGLLNALGAEDPSMSNLLASAQDSPC